MTSYITPAAIVLGAALIAVALYSKPTEFEKCAELFAEQLVEKRSLKPEDASYIATEMCVEN